MSIYARNNFDDPWGSVDFHVMDQHVRGRVVGEYRATLKLPPARQPGDWRLFTLWVDAGGGAGIIAHYLGEAPMLPAGAIGKVISTWGTRPRERDSMIQQQDNAVVQFSYDADFDADYGKDVNGDGKFYYRGNYGGWPPGMVRAVYLRGECGRKLSAGPGIAQINFGSNIVEGTTGGPAMNFITQAKGYCSAGNRDVGVDWMRVVIEPRIGQLGVKINDRSIGMYLNSGFELAI